MSATASREVARRVVSAVRTRGAWTHEAAAAEISRAGLVGRDAASATRLAYGTIAAQGTLDDAIDRFAQRPSGIEPKVRDALRVSAWELLFSDTPGRAAVSEGVELARTASPRAAGLANAVLRRLAERRDSFPWGDALADPEALARATAHPRWLVDAALQALGDAAAREMLEADSEAAPLYLAHNPFCGDLEQALRALADDGAEPVACAVPGCFRASNAAAAVRGHALADGLVVVTDAAAQLAVELSSPQPGAHVVEIGAGRGTKCALLQASALRAGGPAQITAVDVHEFKSRLAAERMRELAVPQVRTVTVDATDADALLAAVREPADLVFVDAPCSGLGTLRRHPEARWRVSAEEIASLAALGARLLEASSELVKPGGVVVYSTCTITAEENQDVISGFLGSEAGASFAVESVEARVPEEWADFLTPEGFFRSWPRRGGPDGHFAARLRRG